jgi:hypothetical protein
MKFCSALLVVHHEPSQWTASAREKLPANVAVLRSCWWHCKMTLSESRLLQRTSGDNIRRNISNVRHFLLLPPHECLYGPPLILHLGIELWRQDGLSRSQQDLHSTLSKILGFSNYLAGRIRPFAKYRRFGWRHKLHVVNIIDHVLDCV